MHGFGLVRYGSTPVSSYIFFPQRLPTLYPQILDSPVFLQKNILLSDWTAVVCLQYREIWQLIGYTTRILAFWCKRLWAIYIKHQRKRKRLTSTGVCVSLINMCASARLSLRHSLPMAIFSHNTFSSLRSQSVTLKVRFHKAHLTCFYLLSAYLLFSGRSSVWTGLRLHIKGELLQQITKIASWS